MTDSPHRYSCQATWDKVYLWVTLSKRDLCPFTRYPMFVRIGSWSVNAMPFIERFAD
jgi:hypothetical protein